MSALDISIASYFSVLVPFFTAVILIKRLSRDYYPFIYFIVFITCSDLIIAFLTVAFPQTRFLAHASFSVHNVTALLEAFLISWVYLQWGLFRSAKKYTTLLMFYLMFWLLACNYFGLAFPNYFSQVYTFIGTIQSIIMVNKLVEKEKGNLPQNPKFIIYLGFIVYFVLGFAPDLTRVLLKTKGELNSHLAAVADSAVTFSYFIFSYALMVAARKNSIKNNTAHMLSFKSLEVPTGYN
jgi:hypothetical protein